MTKLSDTQIKHFFEHGWLSPVPVLSEEELAACQQKFRDWETRNGGPIRGNDRNKSHLFLKWLDDLARHPAILDAVESLLGPDIWLWHAQFFVKEPATPHFVSYHQDSAYWDISPAVALSAWVAFEDSDELNGCLRVIPDTHKTVLEHEDRRRPENLLWRGQTAKLDDVHQRAVPLELKAGEMSLHHGRIVHGSGPNHSKRRRIGYSMRYLPTNVQRLGPRDSALLVRGEDKFGHFDPEPRPLCDFHPEAVRFHARTTERFMSHYTSAPTEKQRVTG